MWPSLCSVVVMAPLGEDSAPQLLELKPSVSEMWPVLGGAGRKATEYSSAGPTHQGGHSVVLPATHSLYWLTGYTVLGTSLGPASIVEMQAISPGAPQVLC